LSRSASVLIYAGAPLAFGALRKQDLDRPRRYRLPASGFRVVSSGSADETGTESRTGAANRR
jgi:hypothetical protein